MPVEAAEELPELPGGALITPVPGCAAVIVCCVSVTIAAIPLF